MVLQNHMRHEYSECSRSVIMISLFQISLMVSVDIKHHVYLLLLLITAITIFFFNKCFENCYSGVNFNPVNSLSTLNPDLFSLCLSSDPEEFLSALLSEIMKADPLLHLR